MYGAFLRRVRESRGLTQAQLAEISGISQPNLSAYEHDRRTPGLATFNRLLVACGYQLAADGGRTVLHVPIPEEWTPRLSDDPPDEPPTVPPDASLEERADALVEAVEMAEQILEWSGR